MTREQAIDWLRQVEGEVYRAALETGELSGWVAVVRVPRGGRLDGKIIIALGDTIEEAAAAAEGQWQVVWELISEIH